MMDPQTIGWMIGRETPQEARNRAHRIAIREARIASEQRSTAAARRGERLIGLAAGGRTGGAGTDLVPCCA